MIAPTAAEIREWSKLPFGELDYADDPSLERLIGQATGGLIQITGLDLATVPAWQEPLVNQAIQGLTEQLALRNSPDYLETLADFDLLKSFSAGSYSEQRRDAGDAMKARMLNAWPWLNELLWGLLTDDKREFWEDHFGGEPAPAFSVTEMDWGAYQDIPGPRALRDDPMWGSDG